LGRMGGAERPAGCCKRKLGVGTAQRSGIFRACQKAIRTAKRLDAALGCGSMPDCTESLKPSIVSSVRCESGHPAVAGWVRSGAARAYLSWIEPVGLARLPHAPPQNGGSSSPDFGRKPLPALEHRRLSFLKRETQPSRDI
jgi:hypothetical protein